MEDRVQFLRRLNLVEGIGEEEVEAVAGELRMRHRAAGEPDGPLSQR